jgi:hypothetical protein
MATRWFQHRSDFQKIKDPYQQPARLAIHMRLQQLFYAETGPHHVPLFTLEGLILVMRVAHGLVSLRCSFQFQEVREALIKWTHQ